MNVIAELEKTRDALKEYNDNIYSYLESIVIDNEAVIVELNIEEQLYEQGINARGVTISDYAPYHEITIEQKKIKNQPYNRVTLRDEGDFHDSAMIRVSKKGFEIIASDFKTEGLVKKYGDILGLTNENIGELLFNYIHPEMYEILKKLLNL